MINRGLTKTSQYFFNSKTGMLEKKEENILTIESLSKQARKQTKNIEDIAKEVNKDKDKKPINQITVITADDNLVHNYFYDFEHSWDASNCLSTAIIKMPKMNTENINYWATYQGSLTVYGGYNFVLDKVNSNSHESEQEAANALAQFGIDSDVKPFFRGTISRIKEYQTYIVLYLDSIGVRFKQKIPDDFRQAYINNQNVRDAFQAICEFIGVQYICPPQIVTETEETVSNTEQPETDGTENDVSSQQQAAQNIANTVKNKVQQGSQNTNQSNNTNQQGLLSNTQSVNQNSNTPTPNSEDPNSTDTNQEGTEEELTNNEEIDVQLNGFADINFDANGAIVHGTTAIETSPDMADTLLQLEESPLEKYLEDETGIVEKVQKFLDGDMFEEIHNNVMDYGAITIEPKTTTTTEISSSGTPGDTSGDSSGDSSEGTSSGSQPTASGSLQKRDLNGWHNGQYYIGGLIYLSDSYINSLSPSEAWAKYIRGKGVYREGTLNRLRARGYWQPIL